MSDKIKIITSPDLIFDQAYSILAVCPDRDLRLKIEQYVANLTNNVNVYLYIGEEKDVKWLLTVAKMVDVVLIDIDKLPEDICHFLSYLLSIPTTYYRCEHKKAQWELINQNRFYDFPNIEREKE